jgi:hypothetical protein
MKRVLLPLLFLGFYLSAATNSYLIIDIVNPQVVLISTNVDGIYRSMDNMDIASYSPNIIGYDVAGRNFFKSSDSNAVHLFWFKDTNAPISTNSLFRTVKLSENLKLPPIP